MSKEGYQIAISILTTMNNAAQSTGHEIVLIDKNTLKFTGFESLLKTLNDLAEEHPNDSK